MNDDLAEKVFECGGEVVVVKDHRALVVIQGKICFCSKEICRKKGLRNGDKVVVNARLLPKVIHSVLNIFHFTPFWGIKMAQGKK